MAWQLLRMSRKVQWVLTARTCVKGSAVNTAVNTLSHTVNLTARVSESQKGQRKLMARTSEGFSEIHGCFVKSRLEVISGWR